MIAYDWSKMPAEERRARDAHRAWTKVDSYERFLAGRDLRTALHEDCRVALLVDERRVDARGSVVYLLVDRLGYVLYIGSSHAWRGRAGTHYNGWIGQFTEHARVIDLAGTSLDASGLERALIEQLQPPYNRMGTKHRLGLPCVLHHYDYGYEGPATTIEEIDQERLAWQSNQAPTFPVEEAAA